MSESLEKKGVPEEMSGASPASTPNAGSAGKRGKRRKNSAVRSFLFRSLGLALVLYVLLFHIVGVTTMRTGDMVPRMDAGDLILFYRLDRSWKAQDVVVVDKAVRQDYAPVPEEAEAGKKPWWRKALNWLGVRDPSAPETTRFICRVVAAPGDTVEVTDNRLIINGNAMIESGIYYTTRAYEGFTEYPVTLGADEYFVMADFRNGGVDSRLFGPVTEKEIQGVVITVVRRNNL